MFEVKFVFFSKKLLCKVPMFFIHRLGNKKVYQKQKKKSEGCHLKKLVMTSTQKWMMS
jgi:hypothetical protein